MHPLRAKLSPLKVEKPTVEYLLLYKCCYGNYFWNKARQLNCHILASHSERHITQALDVVPIVGIFLVILPTRNLTITFLVFFNPQLFEILLLAHDTASALLMADRVGY